MHLLVKRTCRGLDLLRRVGRSAVPATEIEQEQQDLLIAETAVADPLRQVLREPRAFAGAGLDEDQARIVGRHSLIGEAGCHIRNHATA